MSTSATPTNLDISKSDITYFAPSEEDTVQLPTAKKVSCLESLGKRWTELSKGKKAGIIIGAVALIALIATVVGMHFNGGIPQNWSNLTASAQHSMKNLGKLLSNLNGLEALGVFGGGAVGTVALFGLAVFVGKRVSQKPDRKVFFHDPNMFTQENANRKSSESSCEDFD